MLLTDVVTVDDVLRRHAPAIGRDLTAYRNHVYRVLNICAGMIVGDGAADTDALEKVAIAAVFHDLGIWTNLTFDYLDPSDALARDYLVQTGRPAWIPEVSSMIQDHHKITAHRGAPGSLAELFRRADWIDVTHGVRRFGVSRATLAPIFAAWPSAGFHWRLVELTFERFRSHPLTPLPMVKL
jgi:hypothetical protein